MHLPVISRESRLPPLMDVSTVKPLLPPSCSSRPARPPNTTHILGAGAVVLLGKCLSRHHKDLSLIPRSPCFKKSDVARAYNVSSGKVETRVPCGPLDSQPSLLVKFQASERTPPSKKKKKTRDEERENQKQDTQHVKTNNMTG